MSSPLRGRRIVVTRPRSRVRAWVAALVDRGAEVVEVPVFELTSIADDERGEALDVILRFSELEAPWIAFTSAPAVEHLTRLLSGLGHEDSLARFRIASVGPATRAALGDRDLAVDLEPETPSSAALLEKLLTSSPGSLAVLHPTSDAGLPTIEGGVRAAGGEARRVMVYRNQRVPHLDTSSALEADLLTFASPSAAQGFAEGALPELLKIPTLAVGGTTARALLDLGFAEVVVIESPRVEHLVEGAERILSGGE